MFLCKILRCCKRSLPLFEIRSQTCGSAIKRNESTRYDLRQNVISVSLLDQQEAGLTQRQSVLEANMSSRKDESSSSHWGREELDTSVAELGDDLDNALKAASQQSAEGVAQLAKVLGVYLTVTLKRPELHLRPEGAKL